VNPPAVAIVIPVFNEEAVLPELFRRLAALFDRESGCAWSAVLVNDGSRDRSAQLILEQHARDPRFKLVDFSVFRARSRPASPRPSPPTPW